MSLNIQSDKDDDICIVPCLNCIQEHNYSWLNRPNYGIDHIIKDYEGDFKITTVYLDVDWWRSGNDSPLNANSEENKWLDQTTFWNE